MKNFSKNLFTSITIILVYCCLIFTSNLIHAEGTMSLSPSAADESALFIGAGNTGGGGGNYGLFAWKGSSSKLYFNVENTCEKAYFGFSIPKNDRSFATINPVTGQSNHEQDLIFRIIDPMGNPINNLSCFGNTIIAGEAWQTLDASTVNISNRNDAINGPAQLGNPSGYNAFVLDLSACGLNLTGNYSIEFFSTDNSYNPNTASSGFYIPYFDITVADCSSSGQTGRVWSNNWGLGIKRDGDGPFDRAFNGTFYVCSEQGFITQIDFNTHTNNRAEANKNNDQNSGFRAGAFNVSFNTNGPGTTGSIAVDRKSMPNINSPNPQLPVFLNLPDPDFCPLQEVGAYQPAPNFLTGCPGDWCINIQTTQPGQFEILIEGTNGNGQLDMPADRRLIYQITANDSVVNPQTPGYIYEVCIPWDGKDGLGNFVNQGDVTISGFYGQGIYHFPVYDAEFNDDGFIVSTVQPALGPQLLFYDDQMITELSNTSEPKNGTNGCNGPCHSWTGEWENYTNSNDVYGNFNTINTWWFAVVEGADLTTNFSTSSPITITCPADYSGCISSDISPTTTGIPIINVSGANCAYTSGYLDVIVKTNTCNEPISIDRRWFAFFNNVPTDSVFCIQHIELEVPEIINCPDDILIACSTNGGNVAIWTSPIIGSGSGVGNCNGNDWVLQQTSGPVSGSVFPVGTTTITYSISGSCAATCEFDVIVEPGIALDCPADYVGCIGDNIKPSNTGEATVTGNSAVCPYNLDYTDEILATNDCNEPTSIKRTWFAVKAVPPSIDGVANDSIICCQLITLEAPIIENCPSDIMATCSAQGGGSIVNWTVPTVGSVSGNCSFNNLQLQQVTGPPPGSVFPIGATIVTYELTGIGSCKEVCSFTVIVNAGISINCPTDYVGCTGGAITPSTTGKASVQGDVASCPYTLNYTDKIITQNSCNEPTFVERKWYAYFNSNSTDTVSCIQKIQLTTPTFTFCPADIYVTCSPASGTVVTWTAPSGSCNGNTVASQQTGGPVSGSVFPVGTTTITYAIPGSCGATCSFDVIVGAGVSLECPADYVGCIGDNIKPNNTGQATVTGNGAACPYNLDYTDEILETNSCNEPTSIKRKWFVVKAIPPSISGAANDSLICCQLITLEAPVLENFPSDIVASCNAQGGGSVVTWTPPTIGSVSGNCSFSNLQLQQVAGPTSGSIFPIGVTTVSYELTGIGSCNEVCSFTVTVNAGISISCPADYVGCTGGNIAPSTTGQASVQGDVASCPYTLNYTDKIITQNSCNEPTFVERKWYTYFNSNSTDTVSCIQKIQLATPTFTYCPADIFITCSPASGSVVTWTAPSGSCNGNTVASQQTGGPVSGSVFPIGTTTVTYAIPGSCGATCSFDVIVEAGITLTCPADYYGCAGGNLDPTITGQPVIDGKSGSCPYTLKYTDEVLTTNACNEATVIRRKWVVCINNNPPSVADNEPTDSTFCYQNLFLEGPVLTNCPNDIVVPCDASGHGGVVTWTPPTISSPSGFCNPNNYQLQQVAGPLSGSVFPTGTTTVTYQIVGSCNEVCSFTVTVDQGMTAHCEADIEVDCQNGQNGAVVTYDLPTLETCCNDCPSDGQDLPGFVYMGNYNGHNYYCSEGKADWNTARIHCENMGGYLAVLDDAYESNMLSSFLQTQHAFIGLHDSNVEGQFEWVNGAPVNFSNWSYGQPNNYRNYQDYCQLMPNGYWNDNYNSTCAEYILELPCTSTQLISGLPSGSVFPVGTTTVSYAVSDACGAKDTCSFDVTVNDCAYFEPEYCDAEGQNTTFFWIRHVVCGDINNQTGDNGGYGDFTHLNTLLTPGTEETIICSPGYAQLYYKVYWKVCIDFNGDGDFDDPYEEVLSYGTNRILKARFDIPFHCVTGQTRMRVTMKYGSPADCCGTFRYGEVEDYMVTIAPQPDLVAAESRTVREPRIELMGQERVVPTTALPIESALQVKLYPNPVQHQLNLSLEESTSFIGNISIYNNLGQRVYEDFKESFTNQLTIDIAHLPDGLYYLNLESDNGETIVKKFLKE